MFVIFWALAFCSAMTGSVTVTVRPGRVPKAKRVIVTSASGLVEGMDPRRVTVVGNTSCIDPLTHPVLRAVSERYKEGSRPGARRSSDKMRIALAIEGGGMRGCVAAGATAALQFLGLSDVIDAVYGASAGSMVGAYFVARQFAATSIYHDILTQAGRPFIDKRQLLSALGLALSPAARGEDSTVFNLDFLLDEVMATHQKLDLPVFASNSVHMSLCVATSSLASLEPVPLQCGAGGEVGTSSNMTALLQCIRASMNVPGITGRLLGVSASRRIPFPVPDNEKKGRAGQGKEDDEEWERPESGGMEHDREEVEPLADACISEPMPYRSAVKHGATHVIVLRTRPDPCPVLGRGPGLFERVICRRFFRKHKCAAAARYVERQRHQVVYAEDVALLNDAARGPAEGVTVGGHAGVHLLPVAPPASASEVSQLETRQAKILAGMRDGARRTLELFLPSVAPDTHLSPSLIEDLVLSIFPDKILTDPAHHVALDQYRTVSTLTSGEFIR